MSVLDLAAELKRVHRLRRLLEPLAVLYEKTVLEACKEPFEVRLTARQSTDYASEHYPAAGTIHIIDGESLQAAYEVWQEYHRIERELLGQSRAAMSDKMDGDDTVEIPAPSKTVLEENLNEGERLSDELDSLSAPKRVWLEWFCSLSEEDKKYVDICGEKGISVTPANFDQMKKIVKEYDADDSRLND